MSWKGLNFLSTGIDNTNNAKIDTQALAVEVLKEYGIIPENLAPYRAGPLSGMEACRKSRADVSTDIRQGLFSVNAKFI